jgi:hypothetical protein
MIKDEGGRMKDEKCGNEASKICLSSSFILPPSSFLQEVHPW